MIRLPKVTFLKTLFTKITLELSELDKKSIVFKVYKVDINKINKIASSLNINKRVIVKFLKCRFIGKDIST